jgi:hypothetical protein
MTLALRSGWNRFRHNSHARALLTHLRKLCGLSNDVSTGRTSRWWRLLRRALAAPMEGLAAAGATVICVDLNAEGAEDAAGSIRARGGSAEALAMDITDAVAVSAKSPASRKCRAACYSGEHALPST